MKCRYRVSVALTLAVLALTPACSNAPRDVRQVPRELAANPLTRLTFILRNWFGSYDREDGENEFAYDEVLGPISP